MAINEVQVIDPQKKSDDPSRFIKLATEETQQQILNALGGGDYAIRMASSGGYDYFGHASPGTASSAASWKIKRMDSNGIITWADGNASFDNVWDNHSSLTYL